MIDITEMRDVGERYVVGNVSQAEDPLERSANLAIALKQTLGADAPADVRAATNLLLPSLGRAIARGSDR